VRIVFFGTPDFAVPSLRALVGEGFDVAAAVTQPDRPHGRSRSRVVAPPVKRVAKDESIPVLQPPNPNDPAVLGEIRRLEPELGVVVAYGHILRQTLLDAPSRGMVNVHASLLPRLRGAAPIEHAILEGDEDTGVTIMQMVARMDAGPIIHQVATPIASDETGGELTMRLAELGALALVEGLALMDVDAAFVRHQNDDDATYAPKITRDMARIRWEEPASRIARQMRAFDPRPGAWTHLGDREVKLFGPRYADAPPEPSTPGEVIATDPALLVSTGHGALQIIDVQPAGRQRMGAAEWVRGRGIGRGDRFS
jgi:methionyl-tRNA formyltransferase